MVGTFVWLACAPPPGSEVPPEPAPPDTDTLSSTKPSDPASDPASETGDEPSEVSPTPPPELPCGSAPAASGTTVDSTSARWSWPFTEYADGVAWGDLEGDGDLDLAVALAVNIVASKTTSVPLWVFRNDAGALNLYWQAPEQWASSDVHWVDLDDDGDLDLLTQVGWFYPPRAWENTGTGFEQAWEADPELFSDAYDQDAAVGDVNGDGLADLVVATTTKLMVFVSVGGFAFNLGFSSVPSTARHSAIALADVDSDGDLDLALGKDEDGIAVLANDGAGAFAPLWSYAAADPLDLAFGDWNDDGLPDLAVANATAGVQVFENVGGTSFQPLWKRASDFQLEAVAWGDADGDHDLDLAVAGMDLSDFDSGLRQMYLNDGTGFVLALDEITQGSMRAVAFADVDCDGDQDLTSGGLVPLEVRINSTYGALTVGLPQPGATMSSPCLRSPNPEPSRSSGDPRSARAKWRAARECTCRSTPRPRSAR